MQTANAEKYVIPFIETVHPVVPGTHVLEIGCGEAGVLKAFIQKGCTTVGVELEELRLVETKVWMKAEIEAGQLSLMACDIYDVKDKFQHKFDIIVLKDVIEHIHNQEKLIAWMMEFLKPGGVIFFGFPPWYMPWGGHQQMAKTKWIAKMPYIHLLPNGIYRWLLKKNKEEAAHFLEIKETGISIERFEKICKKTGYAIVAKNHYLINPIYQYKFGWKPRLQFGIIKSIPFVRNFLTTCVYYCITPQKK